MTPTPPLGSPPRSPAGSPETSQRPARSLPRSKRWLIFAVGLAALALAYGVGRIQGALALTQAEQRSATDRKAWQANLAACDAERGLLTARRSLSLVALSLDRRNFGVAETHRRDALQALEQPSLSGVEDVSKLAGTVRALNLGVDPDPGAKRDEVIAVSEGLDRILASRAGNVPAPPASATKAP